MPPDTRFRLAVAPFLLVGIATAQSTERVSIGPGGAQGTWAAEGVSISSDGRFVAFHSVSDNLVAGDTNQWGDAFVRDRLLGTLERVSVADGGAQGQYGGGAPSISDDGRYVAFGSDSPNLVAGDTNGRGDVFLRDRLLATTVRVSVDSAGAQAIGFGCIRPRLSSDARYVAFYSQAANLVAGDTNGQPDIFVRDLQAGTTERVSVSSAGTEGSGFVSFDFSISSDGRFVAFDSSTAIPGTGDQNTWTDAFVRDRRAGTTERVSIHMPGVVDEYHSGATSISADGRFVAFVSRASTLVPGDTNGLWDCFVRDRWNATTARISVATDGSQGNGFSTIPRISANGRFVAFNSEATNFAALDLNARHDVFVHDRETGVTQIVSISADGVQGDTTSEKAQISADGRIVAFESGASNLVVGDTNGQRDVYLHDQLGTHPPTESCFGDGTGSACPCGPGAAGNGCPNSVNAGGAHLRASGTSSLVTDALVLAGTGMPDSAALYFQGTAGLVGGAVFGDGLRCVDGAIVRLGIETNAGGGSRYPGSGDLPVSARGRISQPGTRTYQIWYRNTATFCTPATFNLTNGSTVRWTLF